MKNSGIGTRGGGGGGGNRIHPDDSFCIYLLNSELALCMYFPIGFETYFTYFPIATCT